VRIISLEEIRAALDEDTALTAIEQGFRDFSANRVQTTAVGYMEFAKGYCHVKGAGAQDLDVFAVKLINSFYGNSKLGLPSDHGFVALFSAETGQVLALLNDGGFLTDIRTAFAGLIAARLISRPKTRTLGVIGSGKQARLQATMIASRLGIGEILICARDAGKAAETARAVGGRATDLNTLCAQADLIVTTTASERPYLERAMLAQGARIVAVGADTPGKQELETALTASARLVADSRAQCADHGEASWAVRAGLMREDAILELGEVLQRPVSFEDGETVIADLTGLGVQDLAIAASLWPRLEKSNA
jgi:ornithine cyclodeaminase